jgi:hypothetical protein
MTFTRVGQASGLLALVALLAGCAGSGLASLTEGVSSNRPSLFTRNPGEQLTFGDAQTFNPTRPLTAEDYVGPDGSCSAPQNVADASAQAGAPPSADPNASAQGAAPMRGGVALQMTECEVVYRAGPVEKIDVGANERNERVVTLTYLRGPWPGIYRFTGGRLAQIDRVTPPEQPKAKKKAAPKKRG